MESTCATTAAALKYFASDEAPTKNRRRIRARPRGAIRAATTRHR